MLRNPTLSPVCTHLSTSETRLSREPGGEEKSCQSRYRSSAGDSDVWRYLLIYFSGCLSNVFCSSSRKHEAISGI